MANFFSQEVLGVDLRRMFPFETFAFVSFGKSGCKIKILTENHNCNLSAFCCTALIFGTSEAGYPFF